MGRLLDLRTLLGRVAGRRHHHWDPAAGAQGQKGQGALRCGKINQHVQTQVRGQVGAKGHADFAQAGNLTGIPAQLWARFRFQGRPQTQLRIFVSQRHQPLPHPTRRAVDADDRFHQ